jgi:hypothetical protein
MNSQGSACKRSRASGVALDGYCRRFQFPSHVATFKARQSPSLQLMKALMTVSLPSTEANWRKIFCHLISEATFTTTPIAMLPVCYAECSLIFALLIPSCLMNLLSRTHVGSGTNRSEPITVYRSISILRNRTTQNRFRRLSRGHGRSTNQSISFCVPSCSGTNRSEPIKMSKIRFRLQILYGVSRPLFGPSWQTCEFLQVHGTILKGLLRWTFLASGNIGGCCSSIRWRPQVKP